MTDPNGDSPIVPGYSNYLVAMLFGSATHLFGPFTQWYHFLAGEFDGTGAPTGFQFTTDQAWFEFMLGGCAYEPNLFTVDYLQTTCSSVDVPWDDYLGEITVPVFNVGSAGGLGLVSDYTLGLLGSGDITSHIVSLYPFEDVMLDFAHIDLFIADNAQSLVWMPILDWVNDHSCSQGKADQSWAKE
jgi:hypothetical protein